ncbi:MAG: amidohydrolase family protein, partial [Draconibacterium sp.]
MTKRRDFIKKSAIGLTAGITTGGLGFSTNSCATEPSGNEQTQKNWQADPELRRIKYGDWGGPGVSAQAGSMDTILLKDWAPRSMVVTKETFVPKAKFPAIDSHVHVVAQSPEDIADWVKTMDEVGMETSLVLTGAVGEEFDTLVNSLLKAYPGRFQLYCGMDRTEIDKPDYSRRVVKELERCCEMGAIGVGEISDKGTGITRDSALEPNERLHPDDDRLDAFWEKCAELKIPINLHVADHPSAWTPLDVFQERTPDYQHFNLYNKGVPSHAELIAKRDRTL